ncbi:MAG: methyltransferase type 11 [Candidatus Dormibacteraeota bacterium]|nr:methyltransferase type 11 [Candidatus Dormibacteraeota bacterium]
MLVAEARWFAKQIDGLRQQTALFPMLNLGSHTEVFRRREQPWIDREIFAPLRRRGEVVVHADIQNALGIDLVGDLLDPSFFHRVKSMGFRSLLCSNLLEHVQERAAFCAAAAGILEPGARLLLSVPYRFPYHPDPIDTRYRPTPLELAAAFPNTALREHAILRCGTYAHYVGAKLVSDPMALGRNVTRRLRGQTEARMADRGEAVWPWLLKPVLVSCAVLEKLPGSMQ